MMKTAERIIKEINRFDRACTKAEYTPTDEVWDLLHWIKGQLKPKAGKEVSEP